MYVCNCNGLTEKQVDTALKNGAAGWQDVYAYHGCETKCGKCVPEVCQRINNRSKSASPFFGNPSLADT